MKFFYLSSKGIPFLSVLLTIVMGCSVRVGGVSSAASSFPYPCLLLDCFPARLASLVEPFCNRPFL